MASDHLPLRCRWGFHRWGKWLDWGKTGTGHPVQEHACPDCGLKDHRVVL